MSFQSRNGQTGARGTHYQHPLMVSGGPLDDVVRGAVDNALGVYKVYFEDFKENAVDGQMETMGWQQNNIGSATGVGEEVLLTVPNFALFLDSGTAADEGTQLQFKLPSTAASLGSTHNIMPEFTCTDTLMDNREMFFQVRLGHVSATASTSNNKWMIGIFADDDAIISATGNVPAVVAGGGFGFYKSELGPVTCVSTSDAITAVGTACVPAVDHLALTADATIEWHTYAARMRVIDASAKTGFTDFWVDGIHRLRLATVSMDATELYSFAVAIANGPTSVVVSDMHIDYILTGITRPGLTWPYTDGTPY